ncbi:MAG: EamA family transporter RarD [Gammaproteobacteria bacterium]|nr:EamA family transporter RarD [Gammaproteobacteria bacterium]
MTTAHESDDEKLRNGLISALIAYFIWGFLPVYFKIVQTVPALEMLAYRIVWAVPFGAIIVLYRRQFPEVKRALTHPRTLLFLLLSAAFVSVNWFLYIVTIQRNEVFQASLGYYINPLMYVLVGVVFLGEKLRRFQAIAVFLAATGVAVLTISSGQFPWIAITLAISFTVYGVIRKQIVVGAIAGLFIETLFIVPFAIVYIAWLSGAQVSAMTSAGHSMVLLIALSGPLTVLPLLFFALAARRLPLTTLGMMQFLAPTLNFGVAVYYGEVLTAAHMVCFAFIWVAISLFVFDAWRRT